MIQTSESSVIYVGNNSTTVPYPVPYKFPSNDSLVVVVRDEAGNEVQLAETTDYTVVGAGNPSGGSITTTALAIPNTSDVSISRVVPMTQLTSYEEGDSFPAKSHEAALDKLTMGLQQVARGTGTGSGGSEDIGSAFRVSPVSGGIIPVSKKTDTALGLDPAGNPILRTPEEMLGWMGQVGTTWADGVERASIRGAYAGQLGVQIDNRTIYIALSTTSGDWVPFLIGTGIVAATDGVPNLMVPPTGDIVGTDQAQTLYNKTLESPTIHTPTGLTKNDVGLSQVDNTSDLNKPLSAATGAALAFKQDKNEKAISNGYASLDGAGKVPLAQIPDAVVGASQYQGTWNAATNTPAIPVAAVGNKGWYYAVAVAGTTDINGISSWAVGDQIISNGAVWQKIVNVSAVSSVNSKTGAVVLVPSDLGLGNVDNTSDTTKNSAAVTLTNHTIHGANNTLTVRLDADVTGSLPINRLNNGTGASGTTWWCGDNSWKQPPGTGDINGPAGSVDGEVALYSGTTGKAIRRYSGVAGVGHFGTTGVFSASKIMAVDLDPNVISGQTLTTSPTPSSQLLLWDDVANVLKSVRYQVVASLGRNHMAGLIVSNNVTDAANDIDIAVGECRSDDNTDDLYLTTPLTKRCDAAWAAGTNQGGLDTGTITDGTLHLYLIKNPTTGVVDAVFTKTYGAPTMPSGFTLKRRILSVAKAGFFGGLWPFRHGSGGYFECRNPVIDAQGAQPTGTFTASAIITIPDGFKVRTHAAIRCVSTTGLSGFTVSDPDYPEGDAGIFGPAANVNAGGHVQVWSSATHTFRWHYAGAGTIQAFWVTLGFFDPREAF